MNNLFQKTSSYWARYDRYELKAAEDGSRYVTPARDAKPEVYDPLIVSEALVLDALNVGLLLMRRAEDEDLQKAAMDFVSRYGLLGVQMMRGFALKDDQKSLRVCKQCQKAFVATRPSAVLCSPQCKNWYNVYKSRARGSNS